MWSLTENLIWQKQFFVNFPRFWFYKFRAYCCWSKVLFHNGVPSLLYSSVCLFDCLPVWVSLCSFYLFVLFVCLSFFVSLYLCLFVCFHACLSLFYWQFVLVYFIHPSELVIMAAIDNEITRLKIIVWFQFDGTILSQIRWRKYLRSKRISRRN